MNYRTIMNAKSTLHLKVKSQSEITALLHNKVVGIWGFGVVGKSVIAWLKRNHFGSKPATILVFDNKELIEEERELLKKENIVLKAPTQLNDFLFQCDVILPSPGVDLATYQEHNHKFIYEVDLFAVCWNKDRNNKLEPAQITHKETKGWLSAKPIIAITGSVGKTTITTALANHLSQELNVFLGGNIGNALMNAFTPNNIHTSHDFQDQQTLAHSSNTPNQRYDCAVIELSSFQLEYSTTFAPDLAIITNLYPNHMDRHKNMENYAAAKCSMLAHQDDTQRALVPFEIAQLVKKYKDPKHTALFFTSTPADEILESLAHYHTLYWPQDGMLMHKQRTKQTSICTTLPTQGWILHNAIVVAAAANLLDAGVPSWSTAPTIPHRRELVRVHDGITYINDSKSTTQEATRAAIAALAPETPIILLWGGVSKGVDRSNSLACVRSRLSHVFCFGAEAPDLAAGASEHGISASFYPTLEEALLQAKKRAQKNDCILLSPGGASFDLFKDFEQRGDYFKRLVMSF